MSTPPEAVAAAAAMKAPWIQALARILPPGQLRSDSGALTDYGHDESDYGQFPPRIVALPQTAAEVAEVFRLCQRFQVPVTPCGARSGKSGGSLPLEGGIALSLERMSRIKSISVEDLVAVLEPGVITGELMKAVEAQGLFYPPDPNSLAFCTMGGNVAENAGGPRALKYGVTRDYVLGLEWVLPNGEILRVGRQTIKGVAGYDLVGLFVGSEGTLGVATEITVQLLPLPKKVGEELGLTMATYGHAGDGNLHANLLFDGPHGRPTVDQAVGRILRYTVSVGGTITGEHGVGIAKRAYLHFEQPEPLIQLQRSMKHFFDPSGLLNPGKIFPPSKA